MKVAVIINKDSTTAAKIQINEDTLKDEFNSRNIVAKFFLTESEQIPLLVKKIVSEGIDAVIAGGGDGTVSTIAGLLAGGRIPLGVLPLGHFNHFAKDIGVSVNIREAITEIASGKVKFIDVGEVNGHIFINNSSIGIYPRYVRDREHDRRKFGINKMVAALLSFWKTLTYFPVYKVRLETGENNLKCKTPFVFVGNNEYQMKLFSPQLRPSLTEGFLSLYVSKCTNKLSIIRFSLLFLFKRLDQAKDFTFLKVKEATINIAKKRIEISADGEVLFLEPPLVYRIRPEYLPVIIPEKVNHFPGDKS
jgi:diacylglycerol kinase family enzyme